MARLFNRSIATTALILIVGITSAPPVFAEKARTNVNLSFKESGTLWKWRVKIKKEPLWLCRKKRKVIVYHDTNNNGKFDGQPIDFILDQGRTNKKGVFSFWHGAEPPKGDKIRV